ncbi:cob(I)yrinic acid a,c-diamide adenosyltransferase, partial [Caulobacter sp. S45]|uniref:cob(I)yrinic acid a,c-diamide adenosyltransferase n=1 Tax=Caulobacter sp. S45 TaxID=1641861 RepID=UPI0015768709
MVVLNRIYTRTGDAGDTGLATGERVKKFDGRVAAYGDVDEANACVGLVRQHTADDPALDAILARVQNELFDLGADLATPEREGKPLGWEALRVTAAQVDRLEADIDRLNEALSPLTSFVLPAGTAAAAALHLARTVCRR